VPAGERGVNIAIFQFGDPQETSLDLEIFLSQRIIIFRDGLIKSTGFRAISFSRWVRCMGPLYPRNSSSTPVIQDQGIEEGRENQAVLPVVLQEGPEGLLAQLPVRGMEKGKHLAPRQLLFLLPIFK